MKRALAFLGAAVLAMVALVVTWVIGVKRAALAVTGRPTPEEARVKVDEAKAKAEKQTAAAVDEVLHASPEDNLRRARDLTRRGLQPKQ